MATVTEKFGARVKELRKKKGITQEKLAELTKIDYSYINGIESGKKNPTLKRMAKIARVLGTSLRELLSF